MKRASAVPRVPVRRDRRQTKMRGSYATHSMVKGYLNPIYFCFFSSSSIFLFRYLASFSAEDRSPRLADDLSEESAYATTPVLRLVTVRDADVDFLKSPRSTFFAKPPLFLSAVPSIIKSA